jgi:hypothetical protein
MLLSLAAAFATAMLLKNLRGIADVLFRVVIGLFLFASLIYPAFSVFSKTDNFKPGFGLTLDDFDRVKRENPDEASAILFLGSAPDGVIAEAVGGSYSAYADSKPSWAGPDMKVNGAADTTNKALVRLTSSCCIPPPNGKQPMGFCKNIIFVMCILALSNGQPTACRRKNSALT